MCQMEVADGLASTPARRMVRALFEDLGSDPTISIIESNETLGKRGLTDTLTGDRHFEQAGFKALLS